ncbi:MAG: nicotinate (nicotinamide) nucleotide adenylyltransferase, partial [bacterium]
MIQDPICIFGGAFDPIHIGHLVAAEDVRQKMEFAKIHFIPCNVPATKGSAEASPGDRFEMVKLAIDGNPGFGASDIEIKKGGKSYTIDTLREVSSTFGRRRRIFLLMGVDQLNTIGTWRHPEEIIELCTILAMRRPGFT